MKNRETYTGILTVVNRLPSSAMGNPRYLVEVNGVQAATTVDAMLGYGITNYDGKPVTTVFGMHYGRFSVDTVELIKTI